MYRDIAAIAFPFSLLILIAYYLERRKKTKFWTKRTFLERFFLWTPTDVQVVAKVAIKNLPTSVLGGIIVALLRYIWYPDTNPRDIVFSAVVSAAIVFNIAAFKEILVAFEVHLNLDRVSAEYRDYMKDIFEKLVETGGEKYPFQQLKPVMVELLNGFNTQLGQFLNEPPFCNPERYTEVVLYHLKTVVPKNGRMEKVYVTSIVDPNYVVDGGETNGLLVTDKNIEAWLKALSEHIKNANTGDGKFDPSNIVERIILLEERYYDDPQIRARMENLLKQYNIPGHVFPITSSNLIGQPFFILDYQVFNGEIVVVINLPPFSRLKEERLRGLVIHDKEVAQMFQANFEKLKDTKIREMQSQKKGSTVRS